MSFSAPYLGHGLGLRTKHFPRVLAGPLETDWFEIISENYMIPGGRPLRILDHVRSLVPVVMHGVSMSIGSPDPLNMDYLKELKKLIARVEPAWVSDHLCWGGYGGHYGHDLWPLPYTEEALRHVVAQIGRVQDFLGHQILIENVSSYVAFRASTMTEWEFIAAILGEADCGMLLDVNNIFVSASNHGFDAHAYVDGIPRGRVGQMHLAGHSSEGPILVDTHGGPVIDPVWYLYRHAIQRFGRISSLIEWDEDIPEYERVLEESAKARRFADEVLSEVTTGVA